MRFIKACLAGLLLMPVASMATNFQADSYSYYTDTNGNIYFVAEQKLLLIAATVNIPVTYYDAGSFKYDTASGQVTPISHSFNTSNLQVLTGYSKVHFGDFNYDGKQDMYLHPSASGALEGLLFYGNVGQLPKSNVDTFEYIDGIAIYDLSVSTSDYNGDGKKDLVFISDTGEEYSPFNYQPKLPSSSPKSGTLVGRTDFNASVTKGGAASIQVPLKAPVGAVGLTANLSMSYNSQVNGGNMGRGWSLSGLGAIRRCESEYPNNVGIVYDLKGEYCFMGERLVAIQGDHGSNNTYYRTETDQGVLVQSRGETLNGPEYWIVQYSNGTKEEYGNTADSRVERSDNAAVKQWALNKHEELSGASYTVSYHEYQSPGEHLVDKVTYVSQNASIDFHWIDRAEKYHGWSDGAKTANTKILTRVQMISDGLTQRNYYIHYTQDVRTNRPMVKAIQECSGESACLKPLTFGWQSSNEAKGFVSLGTIAAKFEVEDVDSENFNPSNLRSIQKSFGDINGDGFTDLIFLARELRNDGAVQSVGVAFYINDGNGSLISKGDLGIVLTDTDYENASIQLIDMNYDGYQDFVATTDEAIKTWFSSATITHDKFSESVVFDDIELEEQRQIIDMNGDGYPDLLVHNQYPFDKYETKIYKGIGGGRFASTSVKTLDPEESNYRPLTPVDVDGDGLLDLLYENVGYHTEDDGDDVLGGPLVKNTLYYHRALDRNFNYHKVDLSAKGKIESSVDPHDEDDTYYKISGGKSEFIDITNDGVPDQVVKDGYSLKVFEGYGNGLFAQEEKYNVNLLYSYTPYFEDPYANNENIDPHYDPTLIIEDINNDGRTDLIEHKPDENNGAFYVKYGTVNGFTTRHKLDDLPSASSGEYGFIYSSEGLKTVYQKLALSFSDLDGDSVRDAIWFDTKSGQLRTYKSQSNASPMLTQINDGHGIQTIFEWGRMNDQSLYTNGVLKRPEGEKNIITSRSLVSSLKKKLATDSADDQPLLIEYYKYAGAVQKQGKDGYLGFSHFVKTTERTELKIRGTGEYQTRAIITANYLHQNRPYIGKVHKLTTYTVVSTAADANDQINFQEYIEPVTSSVVTTPYYRQTAIGENASNITNWRENVWAHKDIGGITNVYLNKYITRQYDYTSPGLLLKQTEFESELETVTGAFYTRQKKNISRTGANKDGGYVNVVVTEFDYENDGVLGEPGDFLVDIQTTKYSSPGQSTLVDKLTFNYYDDGLIKDKEAYSTVEGSSSVEVESAVLTEYVYSGGAINTIQKVTTSNPNRASDDEQYAKPRVVVTDYPVAYSYKYLGSKAIVLDQTDRTKDHITTYSDYDHFGNPKAITSANGLKSTATYDALGRANSTTDEYGVVASTTRGYCDSSMCPENSYTFVKELVREGDSNKSPSAFTFYDVLGRKIGTSTQLLGGSWSIVGFEWDRYNRLLSETVPQKNMSYAAGPADSAYKKVMHYDLNDRVVQVLQDNSVESGLEQNRRNIYYTVEQSAGGFEKRIVDGKGRERYEHYNAMGQLAFTEEQFDVSSTTKIVHEYDAKGRKVKTTYPKVNYSTSSSQPGPDAALGYHYETYTYNDELGTTTESIPDREGDLTVYSDIFGNTVKSVDGGGNVVKTQYDALNRPVSRSRPESLACWYYDGASSIEVAGESTEESTAIDITKGALDSVIVYKASAVTECPDAPGFESAQSDIDVMIAKKYELGTKGEVISETVYVDGIQFLTDYGYDELGRQAYVYYPTAYKDPLNDKNEEKATVWMGLEYDQFGYVKYLTNGAIEESARVVYKTNDGSDAFGNIVKKVFPSFEVNIAHDEATSRINTIVASSNNADIVNFGYAYNRVGELMNRYESVTDRQESFQYGDGYSRQLTGVSVRAYSNQGSPYVTEESFSYDAYGNLVFKYFDNGVKRHVLDFIYDNKKLVRMEGTSNQVQQASNAVEEAFDYDMRGNVTTFGDNYLAYNSYNKVKSVFSQRTFNSANYRYDENGKRYYRQTYVNGKTSKTYMINGMYERVESGETVEHRHYLGGDVLITTKEDALQHVQYLVKDHLGSVVAILNQDGSVVARYRYTVFGEQIEIARDNNQIAPVLGITEKGFTGHEHVPGSQFVHMGGRIYHPLIGRFMQADIVVQNPKAPVNYNRYAYVMNNPLGYTDPTGYLFVGDDDESSTGTGNESENDSTERSVIRAIADYFLGDDEDSLYNDGPMCTPENPDGLYKGLTDKLGDVVLVPQVGGNSDSNVQFDREGNVYYRNGNGLLRHVDGPINAVHPEVELIGGGYGIRAGLRSLFNRFSKNTPRVFWSGGDEARSAAEAFAKANGSTTLEMTSAGQELQKLTQGMDWVDAKPLWEAASRDFAEGAQGAVHVFHNGSRGVSLESVWRNIEYPVLRENGNDIIYNVTTSSGTVKVP